MTNGLSSVLGIANRATSVRVRNILSPLLWLCAISSPLGLVGLLSTDPKFSTIFSILILAPLILSLVAYVYFALRDPQRLQSEEYLLREAQIRLMSKAGEVKDPLELEPMNLDSPTLLGQLGAKDE
jgi:hypothetical protein